MKAGILILALIVVLWIGAKQRETAVTKVQKSPLPIPNTIRTGGDSFKSGCAPVTGVCESDSPVSPAPIPPHIFLPIDGPPPITIQGTPVKPPLSPVRVPVGVRPAPPTRPPVAPILNAPRPILAPKPTPVLAKLFYRPTITLSGQPQTSFIDRYYAAQHNELESIPSLDDL